MSERRVLDMRVAGSQFKTPAHPRVRVPKLQELVQKSDVIHCAESDLTALCASPSDTVYDTLHRMNEHHVRSVSIMDGNKVVVISRENVLAELVAYLERVFHEYELDQQIAFLQGTYSC